MGLESDACSSRVCVCVCTDVVCTVHESGVMTTCTLQDPGYGAARPSHTHITEYVVSGW